MIKTLGHKGKERKRIENIEAQVLLSVFLNDTITPVVYDNKPKE